MRDLIESGSEIFFKREFPDLKHAFLSDLEAVVCMDEGTAHKDFAGEPKFCMAGSGILYQAGSEAERLEKVAKLFISLGLTDVTSHGGCGAAGLAYRRDFPNVDPKTVTSQMIEEYAVSWSQKLTEKIKELNSPAEYSHVPLEEMERPAEFHNARVVYFDGVGGFNPNKEIDLPMGFVIERKFLPPEYTAEELKVAVSIAFGHHGFGDFFTAEDPFLVVVFAPDSGELEKLKIEAQEILKDNENFKNGKIKVDGMVV